jgi:hypothetical protein
MKVTANTPIKFKGQRYNVGESFEATDAEARELGDLVATGGNSTKKADSPEDNGQSGNDPVTPNESWTREQLNDKAEALGVENPEKLPSKKAVLDAIASASR